jgi:hypothetical protein
MPFPFRVISPEYLRWLSERGDEPRTAPESDLAGPWRILRLPSGDFGLFRHGEHPDRCDLPAATFVSREEALLAAALLPALGRDPLYRLRHEPTPQGFAIESDGDVIGHLQHFNPDLTAALHHLAYLLRTPAAFARLLEAASGLTLAHAEKILLETTQPAGES